MNSLLIKKTIQYFLTELNIYTTRGVPKIFEKRGRAMLWEVLIRYCDFGKVVYHRLLGNRKVLGFSEKITLFGDPFW